MPNRSSKHGSKSREATPRRPPAKKKAGDKSSTSAKKSKRSDMAKMLARLAALERKTADLKAVDRSAEREEILLRVQSWAGSREKAQAWYEGQPLASLSNKTALELVAEGRAAAVRGYLDRIAVGGYA